MEGSKTTTRTASAATSAATATTSTTTSATSEVLSSLFTEAWWMSYSETERDIIQRCTETIAAHLVVEWESKMAIGKALAEAQRILEPRNHFGVFCKKLHFSPRTAYRRISRWKNATANLPEVILQEAVISGMDIVGESEERPFGPYTEAVKVIPMPRRPTPENARVWLEKVEVKRKEIGSPPLVINAFTQGEREGVLKLAYIGLRRLLRKLGTKQDEAYVLSRVIGMAITEFDLKVEMISIAPLKVPVEFTPQRGRPTLAATRMA